MLGNLITTTTTPGPPTTTTTTTTIATLPPTTAMTNATTTTPQPTMFLADSAAPLNVFERYTHLESFLSRFTPIGLEVDLLTTAVYLPLSFLGLSLAAAVLFTWHTPHEAAKAYTVSSTAPPLWRHWRERRRGDALLRLLGFLCCPLLLIHCSFCLLLDLDGVWRLRLLSDVNGFRAFCPLVHSLDVTTRVTIALLVLLIAWRAHAISRTPHRRTISCYCRNPYRRWWCKLPCSLFSRVTAIVLMSFVVGLVGINFWQVTDITLQGAFESVELICSPVGGYQSGFQLLSSDANLMLYEWILNAVIFAPSTLGATAFALLLSRRLLANQGQVVLQTEAEVGERIAFAYSRRVVHRLQLAIAICVLYGLANLPLAAIRLLAVMATPGFAELPDREILSDPTWQRMLYHTTATIICREFADMATTGLLFPAFMVASSTFRHRFLRLLHLKGATSSSKFGRCLWGAAERPQEQPLQPSPSPTGAHSPPVRWSWGKGWRQSYSLPLSPPVTETVLDLGEEGMAEEVDPDQMDAVIEQHNNAYAVSGNDTGGASHRYVKRQASFTPFATPKRWTANGRRTCYL